MRDRLSSSGMDSISDTERGPQEKRIACDEEFRYGSPNHERNGGPAGIRTQDLLHAILVYLDSSPL